jgi:hypothetical protein
MSWTCRKGEDGAVKQQAGEGDEVETSDEFWQAFAVTDQAAEAHFPGEAPFDHPAAASSAGPCPV